MGRGPLRPHPIPAIPHPRCCYTALTPVTPAVCSAGDGSTVTVFLTVPLPSVHDASSVLASKVSSILPTPPTSTSLTAVLAFAAVQVLLRPLAHFTFQPGLPAPLDVSSALSSAPTSI